jgi:hypothetical protein
MTGSRYLRAATACAGLALFVMSACQGGGKVDIPLTTGQSYVLQPSGKLTVHAAGGSSAPGSAALERLRVKRKNEGQDAKTPGCWQCTDCICNGAECACTECTSC